MSCPYEDTDCQDCERVAACMMGAAIEYRITQANKPNIAPAAAEGTEKRLERLEAEVMRLSTFVADFRRFVQNSGVDG